MNFFLFDNILNKYCTKCIYHHIFRKADSLLRDDGIWKSVGERDRRDIYEDAMKQLSKKEKVYQSI